MSLETGTYIDSLVATNPLGSDALADADGHLRLIKATIKATFPNITAPVTATAAEINAAVLPAAAGMPSGAVAHFAMNTAPTGWLKANGGAVSRTTYADLFAAIGTTFGVGDGSTTFTLPDLRGEFLRGWDDGRGADSGRSFGSNQAAAFASHTHNTSPFLGAINFSRAGFDPSGLGFLTQDAGGGPGTVSATGGNETRPRNVALLACIKT